jgi:hypothetical protein
MPGLTGGRITIDELDKITREQAPWRTVVLLACTAGFVSQKTASIAEIMVKNRLAASVFATDQLVLADQLPDLFKQLMQPGSSLKSVFKDLRQIVMNRRSRFFLDTRSADSEAGML